MVAETKKSEEKDIKDKEKESSGSFIQNIRTYFQEVRAELNKVSWPDREDVIGLTRIVLLVTVLSSLILGFISISLTYFLDYFGFDYPIILAILFGIIVVATWWTFRREASKGF